MLHGMSVPDDVISSNMISYMKFGFINENTTLVKKRTRKKVFFYLKYLGTFMQEHNQY